MIYLSRCTLHWKTQAVQWVNTIIEQANATAEARDTTIQILDEFIQICVVENNPLISNARYMSLVAAASAIVATKVHESSRSLSPASFPYFEAIDLVSFERNLLGKIQYKIYPNHNPTTIMFNMLEAWENGSDFHEALRGEASALLTIFWLSIESVQYNPVTIATSALLLAFSKLQIDPSHWLQVLPGSCIPKSSPLLPLHCDVDKCLESFVKSGSFSSASLQICIPAIDENKLHFSNSPSTITDALMSPTPTVMPDIAQTTSHLSFTQNVQGQD